MLKAALLRLLCLCLLALAPVAWQSAHSEEDFLDPDVAFRLSVRADGPDSVEVRYDIAPGYYMYREAFRFAAKGATLGAPELPPGKTKFDDTFQKNVETYRDVVRVRIPVSAAGPRFRLDVTGQGCADKGLCYPPQPGAAEVGLQAFGGDGSVRLLAVAENETASPGAVAQVLPALPGSTRPDVSLGRSALPSADAADANTGTGVALRSGRPWAVAGVFLVAGLLLALTPCVLPMLPILSAIIVGDGATPSRGRSLGLAASYSLGMALVYTAIGIAAGLAGEGLAAALQNPWVLSAFALLLATLALSMFGVYELRVLSAVGGRVAAVSQRLPGGRFGGVFAMGALSALIVSPCVAAPLAGALLYIGQTRDVWLGGIALFCMAAGMSVPLLLLGASAGALLPRAGAWMEKVKQLFGVLLLGVALWTVQSILPAPLVLAGWGTLLIAAAVLLQPFGGAERASSWLRRTAATVLAVFGLMQLVGAASGGVDPLQPLAHLARAPSAGDPRPLDFKVVRSNVELDAILHSAARPVMLDFYADWCVSCKEMERYTFSDAAVRARMAGALLLKADVTANNADDRALLRRFNLFGPPGTLFFDSEGREIAGVRVVGFQDREHFLRTLEAVGL